MGEPVPAYGGEYTDQSRVDQHARKTVGEQICRGRGCDHKRDHEHRAHRVERADSRERNQSHKCIMKDGGQEPKGSRQRGVEGG